MNTDGFVKIYGAKLLDSTLSLEDPPVRLVFLLMLAIADQEGVVDLPGVRVLARKLNLSVEYVQGALDVLMAPDPESRTRTMEGRRIVARTGENECGWLCVNREFYREYRGKKTEQARLRMQRLRERNTVRNERNSDVRDAQENREQRTENREDPPKPPEGGGTTLRDVAAVFREVTGHDLPNDIDVSWDDRTERKPARRMLAWCGGDLGKLREKLQLLSGDNWLPGQGIEQWAKRIGSNPKPATGSAPAPKDFDYAGGSTDL